MNPCGFSFGMDVGACISSWFTGWVPDWLVPLLPYWPIFAVVVGAGIAWRFAGAPGLAAFAAAVGYILGRRSVKTEEQFPHPDASPPVKKKKRTLF